MIMTMQSLVVFGIASVVLTHKCTAAAVVVTVDLDDHIKAASSRPVDDHFVSFTSDWWTNKDEWGPGTSILNMDLESDRLLAAARALTPAIWRIGGTRADAIWYKMDVFDPNENGIWDGTTDGSNASNGTDDTTTTTTAPTTSTVPQQTLAPTMTTTSTVDGGLGGLNYTINHDDENSNNSTGAPTMAPTLNGTTMELNFTAPDDNDGVGDDDNNSTNRRDLQYEDYDPCKPGFCLTGTRWYQVMQFAAKTGVQIVFTLNYDWHTQTVIYDKSTRDSKEWDPTQAREFLEFTKQHAPPGTIFGFELGNEVNHMNRITNFGRVGRGYQALRGLVAEIWPDTTNRPKILGPATTSSSLGKMIPYVESYVDIVTYHKYQSHGGGDDLYDKALERNFYWSPQGYSNEVAEANGAEVVWIGEGAMASDSGRAGVTDTFLSSLWMANALGSMAAAHPVPISTFCRQTLVGGHYGLLAPETHDPYPDFYLMRLWTHLMGNQPIGPVGVSSTGNSGNLLVHAFCGKQAAQVVVLVVNVDSNVDFEVSIAGDKNDAYLLEGTSGVLSQRVTLNGAEQSMSLLGGLSEISPKSLGSNERLTVPSLSIAFVVVNDSTVAVCGGVARSPPPNSGSNAYEEDDLSRAALSVIIAAAALVFVLGSILCCCCGKSRRRRSPHSVLAQDDSLFMSENVDGLL